MYIYTKTCMITDILYRSIYYIITTQYKHAWTPFPCRILQVDQPRHITLHCTLSYWCIRSRSMATLWYLRHDNRGVSGNDETGKPAGSLMGCWWGVFDTILIVVWHLLSWFWCFDRGLMLVCGFWWSNGCLISFWIDLVSLLVVCWCDSWCAMLFWVLISFDGSLICLMCFWWVAGWCLI